MPFKAYHLSASGDLRVGLDEEEVRAVFESRDGLLWVDIIGTTEEDGVFLERTLNLHPLPVEDCVSPLVHPPKVDDFGEYIFMVVHGINYAVEGEVVETTEMAVFLGAHFVVSNHNFPLYSVEAVRRSVEEDRRFMGRGADFLAHALIDALVDNVLPTVDRMYEVAEEIEEEAIGRPQWTTLDAIRKLNRSSLRLHRVMAPQRDLMNRLSRGDFAVVGKESLIYFRDIYDHIVRIEDLNQTLRDRSSDALATYLSSVANHQNETMKVLSMVASIFMPLTLVTGIYGMNFENMPELRWPWGYFAVLGFMATVAAAAVWVFWARRWVMWGRRHVARARLFAVESEKLVGHLGGYLTRWHPLF